MCACVPACVRFDGGGGGDFPWIPAVMLQQQTAYFLLDNVDKEGFTRNREVGMGRLVEMRSFHPHTLFVSRPSAGVS